MADSLNVFIFFSNSQIIKPLSIQDIKHYDTRIQIEGQTLYAI